MTQLTDRVERDLREIAAGAHPSPSAWESIAARLGDNEVLEVARVFAPAPAKSKHPAWLAVAAAALVVIGGSIALLATRTGDDQLISADDPDATVVDFPPLTETFVSPRNGFAVKYPNVGGGTVTPATQLWGFSQQVDDGFDVVDTGLAAVFKGTSTEFPSRFSGPDRAPIDEQVDGYLSEDYVSDGCGVPRSQQAEITIDGHEGRVAECPNHIEATVVFGGRLYLFTLTHDRSDARSVFDTFIATVNLTPETAIEYPAMTTTFVSPTYGYSFKYYDRGGVVPATQRWDPANEPFDMSINFDDRFDAVETALAAYFEGASTEIPDGVSIDEWVDEYVSPGGCRVPRSQQAEIIIDGQSGRIAQCGHSQATVVAGGRLYLFIGPDDDRGWFEAWVATIDLTPETAVP